MEEDERAHDTWDVQHENIEGGMSVIGVRKTFGRASLRTVGVGDIIKDGSMASAMAWHGPISNNLREKCILINVPMA
jgi:hypothetical protein